MLHHPTVEVAHLHVFLHLSQCIQIIDIQIVKSCRQFSLLLLLGNLQFGLGRWGSSGWSIGGPAIVGRDSSCVEPCVIERGWWLALLILQKSHS